jgi:3-oxoacyl-[acyl-carrier protein] reductase
MHFDFSDKTILVTGGTRGIGESIAEHFAALGGKVIATGRDKARLKELQHSSERHGEIRYYHLDFLERGSCESFVEELKRAYEHIDVLVNNAGLNKTSPIDETSAADFDDAFRVNVAGPMLLMREIGNLMKERRYGRIVNIASIFGVVARDKRVPYVTSKTALIGLTRAAAVDLAPFNILVNAVSPGFVMTDMTRKMLTEREREVLVAKVPLRRCAEPEEIARVVLFLASEHNTFITAQNIIIDGGFVSV